MSINHLTIGQMRKIADELKWTPEEKRKGQLWLAKARRVRDENGMDDEDILRPQIPWETFLTLKDRLPNSVLFPRGAS